MTINITPQPAPATPLNLQLGVVYAPRNPSGFLGYAATELSTGEFVVDGYRSDGSGSELYRGELGGAYVQLALCLGM